MKFAYVVVSVFLSLIPRIVNAESLLNDVSEEAQSSLVVSYLKDLEEQGYCVIPQILSDSEVELLYQRVWHEFIEKAWPNCRMDDRSNWGETFPMHNKAAIFAGPAGQTQVMWDLRQDPRIVDVFSWIWDTNDLIVSMDGLSFMCPPEIREGYIEPWPHVDQRILKRQDYVAHNNIPFDDFKSESLLRTKPFTVQGQFLFEDSLEDDGGFYCIPRSHLRFNEFALQLEVIAALEIPPNERRKARTDYIEGFFKNNTDEYGASYNAKHVTAPRGSLILWDSRTIHWNQHASKSRPYVNNPKVRMVGYLCYVPKVRLTNKGRDLRRESFEKGVSTGHDPAWPELKYTQVYQEFEKYQEDPSYAQPKINLTPLGKSLLGIDL